LGSKAATAETSHQPPLKIVFLSLTREMAGRNRILERPTGKKPIGRVKLRQTYL
jgi:hypothetical protein